jgi:ABC-type polysaccharide/polyol phosphate export permease
MTVTYKSTVPEKQMKSQIYDDHVDRRICYGDNDFVGGAREVLLGIKSYRIWWSLAAAEMAARYRRSFLGPFWMTLATTITVLGLGYFWAQLWKVDLVVYFPYLAAGLVTWNYIASIIIEAPNIFVSAQSLIRNSTIPTFVYPMRSATRLLLLHLHQFPVILLVFLAFGKDLYITAPLSLIGVFLIYLNSIWFLSLVGMIGARLRDMAFIIEAGVPLLFFLTPVLWQAKDLGAGRFIVDLNPFAYAIELVRAPILGQVPSATAYIVLIVGACVGWMVAIWAFRLRHRIPFWV